MTRSFVKEETVKIIIGMKNYREVMSDILDMTRRQSDGSLWDLQLLVGSTPYKWHDIVNLFLERNNSYFNKQGLLDFFTIRYNEPIDCYGKCRLVVKYYFLQQENVPLEHTSYFVIDIAVLTRRHISQQDPGFALSFPVSLLNEKDKITATFASSKIGSKSQRLAVGSFIKQVEDKSRRHLFAPLSYKNPKEIEKVATDFLKSFKQVCVAIHEIKVSLKKAGCNPTVTGLNNLFHQSDCKVYMFLSFWSMSTNAPKSTIFKPFC